MLTIKIIGTDEKGKEWLDIIMSEEGLTTEPGHRESRVLFKLPDPDKAPNEGAEPDSGPESIMSELDSESSTTSTVEETSTSQVTSSTTTSTSQDTSSTTTSTTTTKPTYSKQGNAKLRGFSDSINSRSR